MQLMQDMNHMWSCLYPQLYQSLKSWNKTNSTCWIMTSNYRNTKTSIIPDISNKVRDWNIKSSLPAKTSGSQDCLFGCCGSSFVEVYRRYEGATLFWGDAAVKRL